MAALDDGGSAHMDSGRGALVAWAATSSRSCTMRLLLTRSVVVAERLPLQPQAKEHKMAEVVCVFYDDPADGYRQAMRGMSFQRLIAILAKQI